MKYVINGYKNIIIDLNKAAKCLKKKVHNVLCKYEKFQNHTPWSFQHTTDNILLTRQKKIE